MPRLDKLLRAAGHSNSVVRDALSYGKVFVGGVPTADGGREVEPDQVALRLDAPRIRPGRDVAFIYKDPHLVVCFKPPGLLAVPAPREGGHQSLLGVVGRALGSALAVHRLDEETSGLMMVARTEAAQLALKALLERHEVERRYVAIVQGRLPAGEQRIHSFMIRDRGDGLRGSAQGSGPPPLEGKEAITWVWPIEDLGGGLSLVGARLETGRTHQVRIHLADQRCPVLGDPLYAPTFVARRAPRLCLHAAVLGFRHPITGEDLRFEAPLADDLEILRRSLKEEAAAPSARGSARPRRGSRPAKRPKRR